jgi:outer membrane protein TolC
VTGTLALLVLAAAATGGTPLSESDAVTLALQRSPQIKARGHFVDEAAALTEAGLSWNNPLLRLSGLRYDQLVDPLIDRRSYGNHPLDHASVALRWSPPGLGQRGALRAEGEAREADARTEMVIARRDTAALVRKLHAEILNFDAQIALVRDVIEQRAKLRSLVKSRIQQQMATMLDQSLTEVDYLDARTELAEIEVRRRAAYDQLLVQLGLPAQEAIQLVGSQQESCAPPEAVDKVIARVHAANPRLRSLEAQTRATDAERRRRWLDLIPWVDYLQVGYGFAGDNRASFVAFQLQLTLPLFDWKRPHRRALTAHHEALAERMLAEDRLSSDLVLRATAAQAAQAALVDRYREAASVVEGGLSHLRQALESGRITNLFEVVQLQTRLLATKRSYLRATLECKLQAIELDRMTSAGLEN